MKLNTMKCTQLLFVFALTLGLLACDSEDPIVDPYKGKTDYERPIFIVNQGQFQMGTGTITYKENGGDTIVQNAFSNNNEGEVLGNIAQSMIEHQDNYYISINNGGKIIVTEKDHLVSLGEIGDIGQPRSFVSNGEKLYVSSWGDSGSNGSVYEISDRTLSQPIKLGNGPEGMLLDNDLLYVAKSGGFSRDSVVIIINTLNNTVIDSIVVGENPEAIIKSDDGNIYVLCNGYTDFTNPDNSVEARLVRINDNSVTNVISLSSGANKLAFDKERNEVYFLMNAKIYRQNLENNSFDNDIFADSGFRYGLAFSNENEMVYAADAKDFSSSGEVEVYDRIGNLVEKLPAGIIPAFILVE